MPLSDKRKLNSRGLLNATHTIYIYLTELKSARKGSERRSSRNSEKEVMISWLTATAFKTILHKKKSIGIASHILLAH